MTKPSETGQPPFKKLALIGIGLIGSSIARGARANNTALEISAYSRSEGTRTETSRLGIVDSIHDNPADAAKDADLIIVCVHLNAYKAMIDGMSGALAPGAILTDVGSAKACVFRDLGPGTPDNVHLIPGHPVAGTEKAGPASGFAELFHDRWCILTPGENADPAAVDRLTWFWQQLGSNIQIMEAAHHDIVLAITSHLPQLVAYNIVGTASDIGEVKKSEVIKYSAGGFRDFTRIASSPPEFWRDVYLNNQDAMIEVLGRFTEDLIALQRAIRWGDGDVLQEKFANARGIRQRIIDAGQESDLTDFGRHPEVTDDD